MPIFCDYSVFYWHSGLKLRFFIFLLNFFCVFLTKFNLKNLEARKTQEEGNNRALGRSENLGGGGIIHGVFLGGRGGALCVEMGFYADISWESRCNIEINI